MTDPGAHEQVVEVRERDHLDAQLLAGLAADRVLGGVRVEEAGRRLDEHAVGVAVDVGGVAELAGEEDPVRVGRVEEHGRAIPAVVRLALLLLPGSVAEPQVERGPAEHVPASRGPGGGASVRRRVRAADGLDQARPCRIRFQYTHGST